MPSPNPRKRPAPGAVPIQQQMTQPYNTQDQLLRWNGNGPASFVDSTASNVNGASSYGVIPSPTQAQYAQGAPSTVVARRGVNSALVAANRAFTPQQPDPWSHFDENLIANPANGPVDEHDNIELLEEKAQKAKRDAQAKRKQIPPFVQKLNSFLEESKNTDLIRWSEKGDSFIVLDEDEFAKTLIPELFKHNNYASFVRQLNMYGFHKKVGLSDNSMKASERKNKSPSEYYNPYFKRGHPNLLWLINKPKSGTSKKTGKKRGDEGDMESDEDAPVPEDVIGHAFPQQTAQARALPAPESGPLQKKELAVVRDQMAALQQRQKQISEAIQRLRQEHNQLYQQALMFQNMHDRHENSINAILNFLANVFRKSLEEQGGVQNVNDLLASIIPNVQIPAQQGQGSVVDLGDWVQQQMPRNTTPTGTPKRPHRLLPPIPQNQPPGPSPPAASTPSPSTPFSNYPNHQQPQMGHVTEVFDTPTESSTPAYLKQELESNPQEGMMKIIQDANTNAGNISVDLPRVAANTSATLTNDQRNRMLSIMSGGPGLSNAAPTPVPPATTDVNTNPKVGASSTGSAPTVNAGNSVSPIMPPSILPPSIQRISQTEEELEHLQRLQHEQAQKLEDLNQLLGPLSPSGRIPGLEDSSNYFDDNIDLNQYLDPTAYSTDGPGNDFNFDTSGFADGTAFDWNPDGGDFVATGDAGNAARVVETNTPSHKSPSPSGTEEILRNDLDDSPNRAAKRQRQA
ncbi:hypothetical protein GGS23DRAFT_595947 [Durotheca rogersii]|uniref:uncharacterized protein n=1 Tax=Durotheca rogersii TaxID=419775 RepID=UPI0022207776|nr:uncharacterized protein GGS23DRAFT_595947 [Durotheca rogersii]KAI5864314.1 hypothetical protein GGS23DRAFT_595947 [Durotheca rogersii]